MNIYVHFFCVPKRNEPKKRAPQYRFSPTKATVFRVCANSLRSNSALHLSEKSLPLGARYQGIGGSKPMKKFFQGLPMTLSGVLTTPG